MTTFQRWLAMQLRASLHRARCPAHMAAACGARPLQASQVRRCIIS
jgi:hypothetical protein